MPKYHVTLAETVLNTWEVEVVNTEGIPEQFIIELAEDLALDGKGVLVDSRPAGPDDGLQTDIYEVKKID